MLSYGSNPDHMVPMVVHVAQTLCARLFTTIDKCDVPGFLVGWSPLEYLLQSTLEFLYDVTCINRLKKPTQSSNIIIRPLNPTLSSPNITVQALLNALMVD
jgi:hypothetical protein